MKIVYYKLHINPRLPVYILQQKQAALFLGSCVAEDHLQIPNVEIL